MADNSEHRKSGNATQAAADTAQKSAEAMQQAGRRSGEMLQKGSEAMAQTMRHLGSTAAETTQRGSEQLASAQQKLVADAIGQIELAVGRWGDMLQTSAEQWRTLMQMPGNA